MLTNENVTVEKVAKEMLELQAEHKAELDALKVAYDSDKKAYQTHYNLRVKKLRRLLAVLEAEQPSEKEAK